MKFRRVYKMWFFRLLGFIAFHFIAMRSSFYRNFQNVDIGINLLLKIDALRQMWRKFAARSNTWKEFLCKSTPGSLSSRVKVLITDAKLNSPQKIQRSKTLSRHVWQVLVGLHIGMQYTNGHQNTGIFQIYILQQTYNNNISVEL